MKNRNNQVNEIRSNPLGAIFENSSFEEKFQNQTLRPILKFQNDLLLEVFKNYFAKQKNVFYSLSPEKKMSYVENAIQRDMKFQNMLKGIIIGLFTAEEYQEYSEKSSKLNKRITNLLIERIKSQIQLLETQS